MYCIIFTFIVLFLRDILIAERQRKLLPFKGEKVEKFIFGLALGMAGGALIVANNCKLLNLIKKNQEDLMKKAENYIDTKLEEMEKKVETEEE